MIALVLSSLLALAPPAHREAATLAAVVHAQDPDLLLALAYVESRFRADVVSKSGRHCGAMQTRATDAAHCDLLRRDVRESYREGPTLPDLLEICRERWTRPDPLESRGARDRTIVGFFHLTPTPS